MVEKAKTWLAGQARTIRARSTVCASSVRLLLMAVKLAASSAEHSNAGAWRASQAL
jgi:hypothetical protein